MAKAKAAETKELIMGICLSKDEKKLSKLMKRKSSRRNESVSKL